MAEQYRSLPDNIITSVVHDTSAINETLERELEQMAAMYRQLGFTEQDIAKNEERHRRSILVNATRFSNPSAPEVRETSEVKDTGEIRKRAEYSLSSFFNVTRNIVPAYVDNAEAVPPVEKGKTTPEGNGLNRSINYYDLPIIRTRK